MDVCAGASRRKLAGLLALLWLGLPLALPGCIAAGAGMGAATAMGTAYVRGQYRSTEATPLHQLWIATLVVLRDLDIPVEREFYGNNRGNLTARRGDGKKILIEVRPQSERISQLAIRIGTFGDESFSRLIAERVHAELGGGANPAQVSAPGPSSARNPESATGKY
ncbi:MAG: DUF3568 family protein [Akkermansiaceae bacterium]|nr:DUF3568 family protein [Akkermansiaceae bacterium]